MNFEERFWAKAEKSTGCWEWSGGKSGSGYGYIGFRGRLWRAHRVAWVLTNGEILEGMFICHTCDNPPCINPSHLWVGSCADNNADCMSKGRAAYGASPQGGIDNGNAKLTAEDVLAIRAIGSTRTAKEVAVQYGVSESNIFMIRHRETWRHV